MHYDIFSKVAKNTGIVIEKTVKYQTPSEIFHVICGTVDSVNNYFRRKNLQCTNVTMIIDECDEILKNENSCNVLQNLLSRIANPQILLYSATLSEKTKEFAQSLHQFEEEKIASPDMINPKIKVFNLCPSGYDSKMKLIHSLLRNIPFNLCIVFINTRYDLNLVEHDLMSRGYKVDIFTGELDNNKREEIIEKSMKGHLKVLLSTDVLGRGFDCKQIDLVINYECPKEVNSNESPCYETYYHRCGRTGRYTRSGTVINMINKGEMPLYSKIFQKFKIASKLSNVEEVIKSVEENITDYLSF